MSKSNLKYVTIIIICFFLNIGISLAGEWNDKPVICEQKEK